MAFGRPVNRKISIFCALNSIQMKRKVNFYRIERATTMQALVDLVNKLLIEDAGWEPHEQVFEAQVKMTEGSQLTHFYCQTMVKVSNTEKSD
jgi:hypothetical protein